MSLGGPVGLTSHIAALQADRATCNKGLAAPPRPIDNSLFLGHSVFGPLGHDLSVAPDAPPTLHQFTCPSPSESPITRSQDSSVRDVGQPGVPVQLAELTVC